MVPRVVVDANIFISYLLVANDSSGTIVQTFESISSGRYRLVRSDRLIAEIRKSVEHKPTLRARISDEDLEVLISLIEEVSIPSYRDPDAEVLHLLRDRKDNYLLEMAYDTDADYIVSGDRDLLDIRDQLERPRILTAREFLELFEQMPT
ncbi:MAG: putative toxin-antitoxin system toxin component, PIN family [Thermomicrobiales bacterium]|nr:putative toxin-antitoxin system toxin component, PIN family [Thermomicrobiales bacterium]